MAKVKIESSQESPKIYDVKGKEEITVKTKNEEPEVTVGSGGGGGGGGGDGAGCLGFLVLLFLLIGGACAGLDAICKSIWPPKKIQVVKTTEELETQTPPRKILFVSNRNKNKEICLMNTSGFVVNLTNHPVNLRNRSIKDWNPTPSPDGQKIVFVSDRDGWESDIYAMNIDGTNLVHIIGQTPFFYSDQEDKKLLEKSVMGHPAWINNTEIILDYTLPSLPSSWILVGDSTSSFSERSKAETEIKLYMKIPNETVYEKMTKKNNDRYYKYTNPVLSPDKRRIAYIKRIYLRAGLVNTVEISLEIIASSFGRGEAKEISLASFSTGSSLTLTSQAWSPDGDKIVFSKNSEIGVIKLASPEIIWLNVSGQNPSWSPGGKWIAFDEKGELRILKVETNEIKNITANQFRGENPIWVPD